MKIERIAGRLAGRANKMSGGTTPRLRDLLQHHEGVSLEEVFSCSPSREVAEGDPCLIIDEVFDISTCFPTSQQAFTAMLSELSLLRGVGVQFHHQLREDGFTSIRDLQDHPRWGESAARLLTEWGDPIDPHAAYRTLCTWLPSSSPLFLQLLGTVPVDEILFFDLETLGLTQAPIFLAATGQWTDKGFLVRQYLAPSLAAEIDLLEQLSAALDQASALVSYNGKSFDWTMIRDRLAYYGFPPRRAPIHVDLLHHARARHRTGLPDHHLGTMESQVLGIERTGDVPSALVPEYYTAFLETGNPGPLVPIINHNRQDIESLAHLLNSLLRHVD